MEEHGTKRPSSESPSASKVATKKTKADRRRESTGKAKQWADERKRKQSAGSAIIDEVESPLPVTPVTKKQRGRPRRSARKSVSRVRLDAVNSLPVTPVELELEEAYQNIPNETPVKIEDGHRSVKIETQVVTASRRNMDPPSEIQDTIEEEIEDQDNQVDAEEDIEGDEPNIEVKTEESEEATAGSTAFDDVISEVTHGETKPIKEEETEPDVVEFPTPETGDSISNSADRSSFGKTQVAVFVHAILFQWTISFAAFLVFFFDLLLCNDDSCESYGDYGDAEKWTGERAMCTTLGLWLVTIAGSSLVFGTQNKVGWILTTCSLGLTSAVSKHFLVLPSALASFKAEEISVPVLDLFVALSCIATLLIVSQKTQPPSIDAAERKENGSGVEQDDEIEKTQPIVEEVTDNIKPKEDDEKKEDVAKTFHDIKLKGGGWSFCGERVAVEHEGNQYFGTVQDYNHEYRVWSVLFDDGDLQEVDRVELNSAIRLQSKLMSDRLRQMWRANEI